MENELTTSELQKKLEYYCAYQERCHQEVVQKLWSLGISGPQQDELLVHLITHNFLNEERFAKAFAGGKFRIKHWGKIKIVQELKSKKISEYCIRKALESEINEADYKATLLEVLNKKSNLLSETDKFKKNQKLAVYAMGRGFETELVWDCLNNFFN